MEIKHNIKINASIDHVFDYLNDSRNRIHFATKLSDFKLLSYQFKGLGTSYVEHTKLIGLRIKNQFEITRCIPNQLIEVNTIRGIIPIRHQIQLDKLNTLTKVTWSQHIDFTGVYRTIEPFVAATIKNKLIQDLKNLEQCLDNSNSLIAMITAPNAKFWI